MTKLEPTRTSSDLTATDRLRELLDERGVEWRAWDGAHPITVWHDETYLYEFIEYRLVNGVKQVSNCPSDNDGHCELTIKVFNCTPEQAIAATLGRGTCLPYWWTHDGTLHVEPPKLPESISVRLPDQRDREVRSARTWQFTRGRGTCQKVYLVETSDDLIESWYPIGVYLNSKAAGDCAEALRGEVDGIRQFARVVELKVVDE